LQYAILALYVTVLIMTTVTGSSQVYGTETPHLAPFRVGIVADMNSERGGPYLVDMLRHLGYPYDVISPANSTLNLGAYWLLVLYDSGMYELMQSGQQARSFLLNYDGNLLWIGPGIGLVNQATLSTVFGLRYVAERGANDFGATNASSASIVTELFQEQITRVELDGAKPSGYFLNGTEKFFPSESVFVRSSGAVSHFFAYDVSDWWNADPQWPWSRPAILGNALNELSSKSTTVILRSYPRNLDAVFIMRIEDVDPLHTGADWLDRANRFLQAYSASQVPLTVAYIPVYVDPQQGISIHTNADSAQPVVNWLRSVVLNGGTIVQHGYTHQYADERTGVGTEFLLNATWMSYEDQLQRIAAGKTEIEQALGTRLDSFEAPHYKLNQDTVRAIEVLGFKYLYQDTNNPFFEFWSSNETGDLPQLVVIPETLSYIPLGASLSLENRTRALIDQVVQFSGILLQYDHLYDETEYAVGLQTMQYVTQKYHVWTANTNMIGRFEMERALSMRNFAVAVSSDQIEVQLGSMPEAGLTLAVKGGQPISSVKINEQVWSLFGDNYVILPSLSLNLNSIVIAFSSAGVHQSYSSYWGLGIAVIAVTVVLPITRRIMSE
jgi:hypothetical protein